MPPIIEFAHAPHPSRFDHPGLDASAQHRTSCNSESGASRSISLQRAKFDLPHAMKCEAVVTVTVSGEGEGEGEGGGGVGGVVDGAGRGDRGDRAAQ